MSKNKNLVVKTNRLNECLHNLSLVEMRLLQLAIVDARSSGLGFELDQPLEISAQRYAEAFNTSRQTAFEMILKSEKTLFNRQFTYTAANGDNVKTRWVTRVQYSRGKYAILITLSPDVADGIRRIDGFEDYFTKYLIEQTAELNSRYSHRLYELLVQWKSAKNTPIFELQKFRFQLGLLPEEYETMSNFKKRVLDLAVEEINEKTDLEIKYDQVKKGRIITGFKFTVLPKNKIKDIKQEGIGRDINTADMFTVAGLSDGQLGRIARNPSFVTDYNHLVSSTSPAGQDPKAWEFEMINRLKKDASRFKKRPIREYLEY